MTKLNATADGQDKTGEEELVALAAVHSHFGMSLSHVGPKPVLVQIGVFQILFSTNGEILWSFLEPCMVWP